jgi:hypothetical protein
MGQFLTGNLFGYLTLYCVPDDVIETHPWLHYVTLFGFPLGVVAGIHLAGSVGGRQTGSPQNASFAG